MVEPGAGCFDLVWVGFICVFFDDIRLVLCDAPACCRKSRHNANGQKPLALFLVSFEGFVLCFLLVFPAFLFFLRP